MNELSHRINNISTETTMVSADVLSAIIRLDNEGKTITAQDITTTVQLKQSDIDLDFSIGAIPVPDGWTYTIIGNKIVFHIAEGVSLRSGQFAIPVIYRTVMDEKNYVDEDGNQYVDENGNQYVVQTMSGSYTQWKLYFTYFGDNGGIYLGMITQLSQIPQQSNYGDYFTWGADDTPSELSYDGKFLKARVYKFVGTKKTYQWSQDLDGGHSQVALSDVLGIASVDLERNNSTAYEFLDHLTSNTIYTNMIVSNQAFIEQLTAKAISVGNLITVGEVEDKIILNESVTASHIFEEMGFDVYENHTIITNGMIRTNLIDVDNLLGTNAIFKGTLMVNKGIITDMQILGNSYFEGEIVSGPLELLNRPTSGIPIHIGASSKVYENTFEQYNKYTYTGNYNGIQFDYAYLSSKSIGFEGFSGWMPVFNPSTGRIEQQYVSIPPIFKYAVTFILKLGDVTVFENTKETEEELDNFPPYYTLDYDVDIIYQVPDGTKTFKLKDLPTVPPNEPNVVWNDHGTLKIS